MTKEETVCKNCEFHYIEELAFNCPQSCCTKIQSTTEQWCTCDNFKCNKEYAEYILQENKKYKEVIDKAIDLLKYQIDMLENKDMLHVGEDELLQILEDKEVE